MRDSHVAGRARRLFWGVLIGSFLIELAWVLALPAFRGADEFDHAYKADAVAHGQFRGTVEARHGRGQLLSVSADLVEAAGPMCASYKYTGPANCRPVHDLGDGRVEVASGAASYNPAYYVVVGTLTRPFHGFHALFAMRLVTALLSSLLLATAASTIARWARSAWPLVGLAVSATPVLLQSAGVAAPNAVGYSAACLVWAAALSVVSRRGPAPWGALTVGAAVLLVTHTTGVLWLALVVAAVLALRSRTWWRETWRAHRVGLGLTAVTIALTAVACVAWIRWAHTNALNEPMTGLQPLGGSLLLSAQTVWALQTIGAFPLRDMPAPTLVYVVWLAVLGLVVVQGFRSATSRVRWVGAGVLLAWIAVPMALTIVSYSSEALAWQGRYALPLAIGLPMLAGWSLSERGVALPRPQAVASLLLVTVGHLVSVVSITHSQGHTSMGGTFAHLSPLAPGLTGLIALAGILVVARSASRWAGDAVPVVPRPSDVEIYA